MQKKKSDGQPFFSDWIVFFSNFLFINKHTYLHISIDHHQQHQNSCFHRLPYGYFFFCFSPLLQRKIENCLETCGNGRKAISGEEGEGKKTRALLLATILDYCSRRPAAAVSAALLVKTHFTFNHRGN